MIQKEISNILNNSYKLGMNNNHNEIIDELLSIKNIFELIEQEINNKEIKIQIKNKLNNLNDIVKIINKIYIDFNQLENIRRKDEEKIRNFYKKYFIFELDKEVLEYKIKHLTQKEKEYELLKEKTGAIFCNGKLICNERKDNEIIILRTENSLLKNEIKNIEDLLKEKNNIINHLNNKIIGLTQKIENFQKEKEEKYPSFSNINININELKNDNYKFNSKGKEFVNTIELITSNKNINQKDNSNNKFPSSKLNRKLMNKINKNYQESKERNNKSKLIQNDISSKKYIAVNKSLFDSKIKYNMKEKNQTQINKIRSNYIINSPTNKEYETFSNENINKSPFNSNKNCIITQLNKIHRKNNSSQYQVNSLKKFIKHEKNHSVLTESKKYNNIFPGFRLKNRNRSKELNSKNNSLPSSIINNLTKSSNKKKNINKIIINDYMMPYTTRINIKRRNENIIDDFIKENALNLLHNSFLNRTNDDKNLYKKVNIK